MVAQIPAGSLYYIHRFMKWDAGLVAGSALSVETIINNHPQIVAVREIPQ
jgi:hypothetical protein